MAAYSRQGLNKLAEIVRRARGQVSQRQFAKSLGLSHRTITRLEDGDVQEPEAKTLSKIAHAVGYSKDELVAILEERQPGEIREFKLAEDIIPIINQLPDAEAGKVAVYIIETRIIAKSKEL